MPAQKRKADDLLTGPAEKAARSHEIAGQVEGQEGYDDDTDPDPDGTAEQDDDESSDDESEPESFDDCSELRYEILNRDFSDVEGTDDIEDSESSDGSQHGTESHGPGTTSSVSKGYLLRASLITMSPPRITRMLRVPASITFAQLHEVLQVAFDWHNAHAYEFEIERCSNSKRRQFPARQLTMPGFPNLHSDSSSGVTLMQVFESGDSRAHGVSVMYRYDFGDDWEHLINFMGPADDNLAISIGLERGHQEVFCVGGEGAPCVEDCGSYHGFEHLKQLFKDPRIPDPERRRQWYRACGFGNQLDPWKWDVVEVNERLRKLKF